MARSFNGSSDRGQVSQNLSSYSVVSASLWIYPTTWATSAGQYNMMLELTADGLATAGGFAFYNSGNSGEQLTVSYRGSSSGQCNYVYGTRPATNTWTHYLVVWDLANKISLYQNGSLLTPSWKPLDSTGTGTFANSTLNFGSRNGSSLYYAGRMAEVALWSASLGSSGAFQLAAGASPIRVRPASALSHWPMIGRTSPEIDIRGVAGVTLAGTSQADHPRVYYPGRRRTVFVPGAGGGFSDATGSSSLTFSASAVGSSLASAAGSSSIAFTPTAAGAPLADATGTASLAFTVSATGIALADADGSSSLIFAPTAAGSALADVTGAATLTFTPSAVGSALANTAGSASLTFAASAAGSSQIDAIGAAAIAFTASAVGSSLVDVAGTATLTFTASASSGGFEDATGSATLTFAASATGSALVFATGSSTLTFTASAAGAAFADAAGAAALTFSCSAISSDESQVAALEITATLTTLLALSVSVASALNLEVTVTDRFDVEEQGMPSPQVGDIGTPIVVTVRDVAGEIMPLGTTTLRQVILSRRGVTRTYSASLYTDGTDGKIVYTSQDGDFDVAGPWLARGRVEFGGGAQHWTSPPVNFTVEGA